MPIFNSSQNSSIRIDTSRVWCNILRSLNKLCNFFYGLATEKYLEKWCECEFNFEFKNEIPLRSDQSFNSFSIEKNYYFRLVILRNEQNMRKNIPVWKTNVSLEFLRKFNRISIKFRSKPNLSLLLLLIMGVVGQLALFVPLGRFRVYVKYVSSPKLNASLHQTWSCVKVISPDTSIWLQEKTTHDQKKREKKSEHKFIKFTLSCYSQRFKQICIHCDVFDRAQISDPSIVAAGAALGAAPTRRVCLRLL